MLFRFGVRARNGLSRSLPKGLCSFSSTGIQPLPQPIAPSIDSAFPQLKDLAKPVVTRKLRSKKAVSNIYPVAAVSATATGKSRTTAEKKKKPVDPLKVELKLLQQKLSLANVRKRMIQHRIRLKTQQYTQKVKEADRLIKCAEKPWLLLGVHVEVNPFTLFCKEMQALHPGKYFKVNTRHQQFVDDLAGIYGEDVQFSSTVKDSAVDYKRLQAEFRELPLSKKECYFVAAHKNKEVILKLVNQLFSGHSAKQMERIRTKLASEVVTPEKVRDVMKTEISPACMAAAAERNALMRKKRKHREALKLWRQVNPLDVSEEAQSLKAKLLSMGA